MYCGGWYRRVADPVRGGNEDLAENEEDEEEEEEEKEDEEEDFGLLSVLLPLLPPSLSLPFAVILPLLPPPLLPPLLLSPPLLLLMSPLRLPLLLSFPSVPPLASMLSFESVLLPSPTLTNKGGVYRGFVRTVRLPSEDLVGEVKELE